MTKMLTKHFIIPAIWLSVINGQFWDPTDEVRANFKRFCKKDSLRVFVNETSSCFQEFSERVTWPVAWDRCEAQVNKEPFRLNRTHVGRIIGRLAHAKHQKDMEAIFSTVSHNYYIGFGRYHAYQNDAEQENPSNYMWCRNKACALPQHIWPNDEEKLTILPAGQWNKHANGHKDSYRCGQLTVSPQAYRNNLCTPAKSYWNRYVCQYVLDSTYIVKGALESNLAAHNWYPMRTSMPLFRGQIASQMSSETRCALKCQINGECAGYSFNDNSGQCKLHWRFGEDEDESPPELVDGKVKYFAKKFHPF